MESDVDLIAKTTEYLLKLMYIYLDIQLEGMEDIFEREILASSCKSGIKIDTPKHCYNIKHFCKYFLQREGIMEMFTIYLPHLTRCL